MLPLALTVSLELLTANKAYLALKKILLVPYVTDSLSNRLPFPNVLNGRSTIWTHKTNVQYLGNIPSDEPRQSGAISSGEPRWQRGNKSNKQSSRSPSKIILSLPYFVFNPRLLATECFCANIFPTSALFCGKGSCLLSHLTAGYTRSTFTHTSDHRDCSCFHRLNRRNT